jgi:hypothetical protein
MRACASSSTRRARRSRSRVEGFRQVVVGPDLEPDDPVDLLALGGEHQDRDGAAAPGRDDEGVRRHAFGGFVLDAGLRQLLNPEGRAPAQDGADAGEQLARVEGFRQVVVGPDLEPDDPVDLLGREMDRLMADSRVDLVVLDLMLPGEDGLSICRRLRG